MWGNMKFLLLLLLPATAHAWTVQGDLSVTNNLSVSSYTTIGSSMTVGATYITGRGQGANGTSQYLSVGTTRQADSPLSVETSVNQRLAIQSGFDANSAAQIFIVPLTDAGNAAPTALSLTNSSNAGVVVGGQGPAVQTLDVRGGGQFYGTLTVSGATGVVGAISVTGLTGSPTGSTGGGGYICWASGVGHFYYKTTTCP
jgi:hypothetical protein